MVLKEVLLVLNGVLNAEIVNDVLLGSALDTIVTKLQGVDTTTE
jgi:hypothetical protein